MSAFLYLILPRVEDAAEFARRLAVVLAAAPVAAVLIPSAGDDKAMGVIARALVPVIQQAGAAAILEQPQDARLVARAGADGAHYPHDAPGLAEAIATLKPQRIVGIGGLRSRHDAMQAGERDVDYLMFGEPRADGFVPPFDQTIERAGWWADIFNTPAVACAADAAAVGPMAETGAEFVALGPWIFSQPDPAGSLGEAFRLASARRKKPD
ncbi:MAG TPA: thiamine phosphate synthase [Beijerinckiaceae bacterium]|nr:thiamine phosphate synthase [Beijerinckiaceae bacterium]